MPVRSIVITGISGPVGQFLLPWLGPEVADRLVGIDPGACRLHPPRLELVAADILTGELGRIFAGSDTVVHLAWTTTRPGHDRRPAGANVDGTRRVLAAAAEAGVTAIVHLSSATAYGAWPDNPVPLTEEAALRPNPGVVDAIEHAEAERLVAEWAEDHPGITTAVLRPATVLGPQADTWLARIVIDHAAVRSDESDPVRQFVHVADVASAVALAVRNRLDGVFNVAPDGSVSGDVVRGLSAGHPTLVLPARLARSVGTCAWGLGISGVPPAVLALTAHPWVIANDRLRAQGWEPRFSSEEAVVAGRPGGRWREMGPGRRQEVALAAAGGGVASVVGGLALALLRARSRRRS